MDALPEDAVVSMNLWGFRQSFMGELEKGFARFLETEAREKPDEGGILSALCCLSPPCRGQCGGEGADLQGALVRRDLPEDKQMVMDAVQDWKRRGLYPEEF